MSWCMENDDSGDCDRWLIRDESTDNYDIVAEVPKTFDEQYDDRVVIPNAQLIASAPDLLEALEAIVRQPQGHTVDDARTDLSACVKIARAAIKKARGE